MAAKPSPILSALLALIWPIFCFFISQILITLIFILAFGADFMDNTIYTFFCYLLISILEICLIIVLPYRTLYRQKTVPTPRCLLGLFGLPTFTDLLLAPAAFFIFFLLSNLADTLMTLFPWYDATEVQSVGFSNYLSSPEKLLVFLTLVIIVPITEELIFRGFLYGRLRDILSKKLKKSIAIPICIFLVSVVFAFLHGQWNVAVNVFILSIFLCLLRETTGTIYASIFLHMLKNGIAFFLLYVIGM